MPAHWEDLEDFAITYPEIEVIPDRFVIDGRYFTTGGASPTFDFMLHLIRKRHGATLALRTGFGSTSAFSRAFKKQFGHSPDNWRKLNAA